MMKPAVEKVMEGSRFVKKEELETMNRIIAELEAEVNNLKG